MWVSSEMIPLYSGTQGMASLSENSDKGLIQTFLNGQIPLNPILHLFIFVESYNYYFM